MDNKLVDFRYIAGRDNYSCIYCGFPFENSNINISILDPKLEANHSNVGVRCRNDCSNTLINAPPLTLLGRLMVISGPMYSAKSTISKYLVDKYTRIIGSYRWVKPDIDIRGLGVTTHNQEEFEALVISASRPDMSLLELKKYSILIFDEAQFYSERILYVVHQLLKAGKLVIVNGLKLDYRRNLFGCMHYLLAEADEIISLKSICNICQEIDSATRTKKKSMDGPSIDIGGEEKYITVCVNCDR